MRFGRRVWFVAALGAACLIAAVTTLAVVGTPPAAEQVDRAVATAPPRVDATFRPIAKVVKPPPPQPLTPPQPPQPAVTGTAAADPAVPQVEIFSAPGVSTGQRLSETPEHYRLVFLVVGQQPGWVHVQLPERPNGATGWVKASDVTLRPLTQRIVVSLSQHRVTLLDNGQPVVSTAAVIGRPSAPTPTGDFFVTSIIHLGSAGGPYGVGALGLAAFSDVYETFGGGPGQVAIHGTNEPGLVGQSVSHGCVRIPNDVWTNIANRVVTGTPVEIQA